MDCMCSTRCKPRIYGIFDGRKLSNINAGRLAAHASYLHVCLLVILMPASSFLCAPFWSFSISCCGNKISWQIWISLSCDQAIINLWFYWRTSIDYSLRAHKPHLRYRGCRRCPPNLIHLIFVRLRIVVANTATANTYEFCIHIGFGIDLTAIHFD